MHIFYQFLTKQSTSGKCIFILSLALFDILTYMLHTFHRLFYPMHFQELQNNFKSDLSQVQNLFESSSLRARFKAILGS